MNEEDVQKVAEAIALRAEDMAQPWGQFLHVLRDFAKSGKIGEIAVACELYFAVIPRGERSIIRDRLPNIIFSHYLPKVEGFDFFVFLRWKQVSSGWADSIRRNASSARLSRIVEGMVNSMEEFGRTE